MPMPLSIQTPDGSKRILLHTCCAPCSSAIIECLLQNGITPVIYYCNPNIYPQEEYLIRKNECSRYAQSLGLEIVDADYDHDVWLQKMKGMENEPERGVRCLNCFKMRLLDIELLHNIQVLSSGIRTGVKEGYRNAASPSSRNTISTTSSTAAASLVSDPLTIDH